MIYALETCNWLLKRRIMSSQGKYNNTFKSAITMYDVQKPPFPSTSTAKQRHVSLYYTPLQDSPCTILVLRLPQQVVNRKVFERQHFIWSRHSLLSCKLVFQFPQNEACYIFFHSASLFLNELYEAQEYLESLGLLSLTFKVWELQHTCL